MPRSHPITIANLYDWFPCAWTDNPFVGEPYWQLQAMGTLVATQIIRLVPPGAAQQAALIELRQTIDTALTAVPVPDDPTIPTTEVGVSSPATPATTGGA